MSVTYLASIYINIVLFQVADKRVDDLIKTLIDQVQQTSDSYRKALRNESKTNKRLWKQMKKLNKKIIKKQTKNHETDNFAKPLSYLNKLTTDKSQASKSNERKEDTVRLERKSRSKTPPPSTSKEACLIKHQTHRPSTITETNSKQQLTLKKSSSPGRFRPWSRSGLRSRSRSRERLRRRYRTRSSSRSSCSSSSEQSDSNPLNSSRRSRLKNYSKSQTTKPHLSPAQNIDVYKKRPRSKRDYSSSSSSSCSSSSSSSPSQKRKNRTLSRPYSPQHTGKTFQTRNGQNSTCTTTHTVHQIRQGSNFMTKNTLTTVTSSVDYQGELNNFKNNLSRKISGSDDSDLELREIDLLVHDNNGKNVTRKRPNGDLNHPFYVHPEDGKLKYTRCTIIHLVIKG